MPLLLVALGLSCSRQGDPPSSFVLLPPREQLLRLSVDLRGRHPREDELLAIEADPALYPWYVDRWLSGPDFVDRMTEVWAGRLLTMTGETYDLSVEGATDEEIAQAIGLEPLALFQEILTQDLPYGQIVLADHTVANPLLAELFALDRAEGEGWTRATYLDGRPHAGILTMNTTWLRYPSMGGNANRHRANALSKMLLCDDYLTRPIVLSRAAVDQLVLDPEDAISENDACQSCHSTLDPLAAHLFGFFEAEDEVLGILYHPEHEQGWRDYSGKGPGYYGRPTANLHELAQAIATDGRFADCATQTAFEGLLQRAVQDQDWADLQGHRAAFVDHGQSIKELVRSVLLSPEYRAQATTDPDIATRFSGVRTASPAQLASIVQDITGYRWTFDGVDGLRSNALGLPVLAGGIDSYFVTTRGYEPGVGTLFTQERLAWSAAYDVARHDLDVNRQDDARLLLYVTVQDRPETSAERIDAQIRHLYLAATGLPLAVDATEPAALTALWAEIWSVEGDATLAWAAVLSAVLRDPRVLTY
jgi:hypothetical protein